MTTTEVTQLGWVIDAAEDGVPTRAHCGRCNGFGWRRHDDDTDDDTAVERLLKVARWHHCPLGLRTKAGR
jgi:hypothetical protein